MIAVVLTACARPGDHSTEGPNASALGPPLSYGGTLTVGPQDAGKTLTLGAGNSLVFSVSGASPSPGALVWRVLSYPKDLLNLTSQSTIPPFRFLARRSGIGELKLIFGPACGGPGPLAASDNECPLAGSASAPPGGTASTVYSFPLKVLARGL